jgi:small-conductance mechanosensitive channel/CRP-like cAMP-binding protein
LAARKYASLLLPAIVALGVGTALVMIDSLIALFDANLAPGLRSTIHGGAESLFWLMVAWFVSRVVDVFLWQSVEMRTGRAAPKLLVAVGRLLILLLAVALIVTVVFQQALTGLVVSSGVVGIVLGFALQRMIADFFSGIAISMESPFSVGHWIEIDGVAGRVIETNWRATRLITLEQVTVVVPNSLIGEKRFLNYSLPEPYIRTEVQVTLEFSIPPADAHRALLAAVRSTEGILPQPASEVILREISQHGHMYTVRFFIRDYPDLILARGRVNMSIARHLWQAGFTIAYPKRDVFHAPMPHRDVNRKTERDALLSRVELFESLQPEELRLLAASLIERRCHAGQQIVRQGEPGTSLFVVVDGLVEARVENNGQAKPVGRIGPGEFFGEISLLTGSPRGATVVAITDATLYELSHEVISPILQNRPAVAEAIGQFVAMRRLRNSKVLEQTDAATQAQQQRSFTDDLLRKIKGFFKLEL